MKGRLLLAMLTSIASAGIDVIYCPKAYTLEKHDLTWSADAGKVHWQATDDSLSEEAASFVGAQWDGIEVGAISCVYQDAEAESFPVVLKNDRVFTKPNHANWKAEADGTYTCHNEDPEECPLYPQIETQAELNIHELMRGIKS